MQNGLYIVFEGVVASGKTTQSKRLYEHLKVKFPNKQVLWTREPGGSEIADAIRQVVQATPFTEQMDPICEAYLYAASRAQTLRFVVDPVLQSGGIVIADRSFLTSVAFQGAGRGLPYETILKINEIALGNILPNCILYINTDLSVALARANDHTGDKFESMGEDFFTAVARGYAWLSAQPDFANMWIQIDGNGTMDEVYQRVIQSVEPKLLNFNVE